jgi:GntR family transcriptional regulator, transcriptional repressor for pyruvate dehydrogenase complex
MSQATAIFEKLPFAPTLSDQVAQALFARIESGQLKPGEKLPSEVVLAAEFGVSRSVVRDAISRLKHEALLGSRQGSGVFVSLQPAMNPLKIDASVIESREEVLQVVELRRALESEAAAVAAQRRSSSQLAEIEGAFAAASHMFNAARRIAATEFPSSEVFYFTLQFPCQAPAPYSFTQNQP